MKKLLALSLLLITALAVFTACSNDEPEENDVTRIVIGATPRPHLEILNYIAPYLLEDGIEIVTREFTDFHIINPAVTQGDLDANYFQHAPFLNASPQADDLYMLGLVHIEPMGAYSHTLNSIDELFEGAVIAIPNDATNGGRALLLLQTHGLLTVDPAAGVVAAISDILENPLNLQFEQLDAALLPAMLNDPRVDMAIINTNHVLNATNLNPMRDSLIIEATENNPFSNGIAVRVEDANSEVFLTILRHLQSQRVYDFIMREYDGAVLPVFTP